MDEPIHIITQTKEDYEAEQTANYREGIRFSEVLAVILILVGIIFLNVVNTAWGIILIILGIVWLVYSYKRARRRIKAIRDYGRRELYRIRHRHGHRRYYRHRRH